MNHIENWIWLPREKYPNAQTTVDSGFKRNEVKNHTVAEFKRDYSFPKNIVRADLRFSGDTAFRLFCNKKAIATGPACVGGDFYGNDRPRENFYSYELSLEPNSSELNFFAQVRMMPAQICEFSRGHGGFMLSAILTLSDGSTETITTDESWLVRRNGAFIAPCEYDGRIAPDEFVNAESVENIWNTTTAPIPVREEHDVFSENSRISLSPGEEKTAELELDMIWGGFVHVISESEGEVSADITCREINESGSGERLTLVGNDDYCGFYLHSAGNLLARLKNHSDKPAVLTISLMATHYPITEEAMTTTSDPQLDLVLNTCKHTLKVCRQTHHLDSPRHCEPLACTGDYYIETLMTPFSFGDMRLSEFDILRTAVMLERENGRMFHTTYSLIWVKMLYDVYMLTGNISLLESCEKALRLLLKRFETYIGENGLIETPPDYMFIDWIYIDGISMHHPPKALGQSCLNMYYFAALDNAEKIFAQLSKNDDARYCAECREKLRGAINSQLFDSEKGIYFEGLNTPTDEKLLAKYMPQNTEKRYYLKHSNILAACFGVCDNELAKILIDKVFADEIEGGCQPYFMHFLFEAVARLGLREKYTLRLANEWKKPVLECPKGLVEGFIVPEPTYSFDHSHAWGGTPLYALPKALMGLEILEPGMKKLSLSPSLLGLDSASVELLTPHGKVVCKMSSGSEPIITAPDGVEIVIR